MSKPKGKTAECSRTHRFSATTQEQAGTRANASPLRLLIVLAVVILAVGGVLVGKGLFGPKPIDPKDPPAQQLQQALEQKRVVFALYHSTTCIPCKEMERIAADVMPEFKGKVVFVDVNVYDEANLDLLRQMQIRVIPTTFIHDRKGEHKVFQGVISHDALRAELRAALSN